MQTPRLRVAFVSNISSLSPNGPKLSESPISITAIRRGPHNTGMVRGVSAWDVDKYASLLVLKTCGRSVPGQRINAIMEMMLMV